MAAVWAQKVGDPEAPRITECQTHTGTRVEQQMIMPRRRCLLRLNQNAPGHAQVQKQDRPTGVHEKIFAATLQTDDLMAGQPLREIHRQGEPQIGPPRHHADQRAAHKQRLKAAADSLYFRQFGHLQSGPHPLRSALFILSAGPLCQANRPWILATPR